MTMKYTFHKLCDVTDYGYTNRISFRGFATYAIDQFIILVYANASNERDITQFIKQQFVST